MSYLIDTNVISELIKPKPSIPVLNWLSIMPNESLFLSVITLGEIRKEIEKIKEPAKKEKIRIWLEHELPTWFGSRILSIDSAVQIIGGSYKQILFIPSPLLIAYLQQQQYSSI